MPEIGPAWSEELDVNISFPQEHRHDIEATVLAESLYGLNQLAQKANSNINRGRIELSVKISGGFHEGSFEYTAVLDFFGSVLPVVQNMVDIIKQVIEYRRFLGGHPPMVQERLPNDGGISVTNHDGAVNVFQNCVIGIGDSYHASRAIQKMFSPLAHGSNQMEISGGTPESASAIATSEDRRALTAPDETPPEEEEQEQILEILTAQMDGKPDNWRFYSVEDDNEFTASVEDFEFLKSVRESRIAIVRNGHAYGTVKIIRQKINNRARTIRTILRLTPFTPQEEAAQFA